jgi:hypothetical protein
MRLRPPRGIVGFTALASVLAVAGAANGLSGDSEPSAPSVEVATPEYAPDSNFPEPSIGALPAAIDVPGTSLSLRPPDVAIETAAVRGRVAVEIAEREFGPSAFPESVSAWLAQEGDSGRLVWAVSFRGICVPLYGPPGAADGCASNELIAVVDAVTGQVDGLVSFR